MPVRQGRIYSFSDIGRETFKGLPGMLADSLPDTYGRALFDRWLALTGRSSGNAVETLCFLGKRCMGALEFEPAMDAPYSPDVRIELDSLVEVTSEALSEKEEFGANLEEDKKAAIAEIVRLGTSAGGQRAKAIIAYNPLTGEVRSGQIEAPEGFDYYLIKLDGVTAEAGFRETQNFGRLEYSFYRLVKECGIKMSDCSLIEENGRAHFLTKRFDRQNGEKIHMQTLCGIAHYDYCNPRSYSYEQAFNVMRALRLPYSQAQEMYRRMVFNVVIRNQDDHTKNISFLMDRQGKWILSPAYDMGFAYNPKGGWTAQHQMSINGKFDDITRQDLLEFAKRNNIKEATEIIDRIAEVSSRWPLLARECEVPQPMIEAIMPNLKLSI
ncbi:type II toxin-antitoxin system HipA family toxin, partial [uncultured Muribaculum sp.]|uniref:type II toxin-antitoxin system HipA family toxin n=1 Tax=uncultured Muribaculum sp. TaxID=1918613 RepID=UPI002635EFE5